MYSCHLLECSQKNQSTLHLHPDLQPPVPGHAAGPVTQSLLPLHTCRRRSGGGLCEDWFLKRIANDPPVSIRQLGNWSRAELGLELWKGDAEKSLETLLYGNGRFLLQTTSMSQLREWNFASGTLSLARN
ncbi:hypothetical protein J6590_051465 [Homalodisca vitripennis]|nr:hypothetical protein J6590_051465 [Homalodisca vitripennis]